MKQKNHTLHSKFFYDATRNILFGILFIVIALVVGMLGYHWLEDMTWIDAFVNASMILSGMGPAAILNTISGKIFAGLYALFSGLIFIAILALVFSPIIHHIFRKVHLEHGRNED